MNTTEQTHLNSERVNTHQLNDGDVILCHGCTFQLKNKKVWPMAPNDCPTLQGECITFETVGLVYSPNAGFPQWWFDDWVVQGNKLAIWTRLVEVAK